LRKRERERERERERVGGGGREFKFSDSDNDIIQSPLKRGNRLLSDSKARFLCLCRFKSVNVTD